MRRSIGGSLTRRGVRRSLHAMFAVLLLGCALSAVSSVGRPAHGAVSVPVGFTRSHVAGGLRAPTAMAFAPDGRIFVTEQGGDLRVIENGELLAEPFASLPVDSR